MLSVRRRDAVLGVVVVLTAAAVGWTAYTDSGGACRYQGVAIDRGAPPDNVPTPSAAIQSFLDTSPGTSILAGLGVSSRLSATDFTMQTPTNDRVIARNGHLMLTLEGGDGHWYVGGAATTCS